MTARVRWCCACGEVDPEGMGVCRVSEAQMGEGRGLTHLIAYGTHARAMRVWRSAEVHRRALGIDREPPA